MKRIVFDIEAMVHLFVLSVMELDTEIVRSFTTPKDAYAYIRENRDALWIGYNSNGYDDYFIDMLIKSEGTCTPEELRELSDDIIENDRTPRKSFLSYDVFDPIEAGMRSLKMYCGSVGYMTYDSPYSFRESRFYNAEEIKSICIYCEEDVRHTAEIFKREYPFFEAAYARIDIMRDAGYEIEDKDINRFACCRAASFARAVFERLAPCRDNADDMRTAIKFVRDYAQSPHEDLVRAYRFYADIVESADETTPDNVFYKSFVTPAFENFQPGLNIQLGFGGIHGALDGYLFDKERTPNRCLLYGDVTSMYPTLMIKHDLYPYTFTEDARNLYEMAYSGRLTYKENGEIAKSAACKRILNSLTGMLKDPYAKFRAPWANNSITINGQLSLLELACDLRDADDIFTIVQVNTDGIVVECEDTEENRDLFRVLLDQYEQAYQCQIKQKEVQRLIQTDVNNYAMLEIGSSEYIRKGITYNYNETYFRDKVIVRKLLPDAILAKHLQLEPIIEMVQKALYEDMRIEDFFVLIKVTDTFPFLKEEISGQLIESRCVRCIAASGTDEARELAAEEGIDYVHYVKVRGNREQSSAVSLFPDIAVELPGNMELYDKSILAYLIDVRYYAALIQRAVWNFYDYKEQKPRSRKSKKEE